MILAQLATVAITSRAATNIQVVRIFKILIFR